WFDEIISKNKTEQGWGEYPFDERPQREKRLNAIINHNNKNNETKKDKVKLNNKKHNNHE
ncbi:MAG: hypothetical protein SO118_01740, partial [Candidatus Onthomorpha sp.]|nr:hypothetical protein [Candidatus Onthomorpha sp.]